MATVQRLQQQGFVKIGFDRAGSSTAHEQDIPLFATGDPEKLKQTMWFYGYATATKRCILMEAQNFSGTIELICINGGQISQVEASEMPRILAEAIHDADLSEVEISCEFKISKMAYFDFTEAASSGDW